MKIEVSLKEYKNVNKKNTYSQRKPSIINAKKTKLLHNMLSVPREGKVTKNRNMTDIWYKEVERVFNEINGNLKTQQSTTIKASAFDILISYLEGEPK